jgi:prepilin-type N-terminal cleavage/methylation domain-containing protein
MRIFTLDKRRACAGFTLIEMIGVMVVISILFAAAVPSIVNLVRTQRSVDDRAELPKIAAALKLGMLLEQRFPIDMNASSASTDADADYWWNIASRHGAGSANEARYPLGASPGEAHTRKLYFAQTNWAGQSFFQVTGDGSAWLGNPLNPQELRLLLVSTTNPDLALADVLTSTQFNTFWNDWAVGSDGNPALGSWSDYGLSNEQWAGRAPELNVERIDLRDWLCTVVIENRRAIEEDSGADLSSALSSALGFWDRGSVSVSSSNLQDAEFIIQARDTTEDLNRNNNLDSGEDANGNGVLDSGEDLNGNSTIDYFLDETINNVDYNRNNVIDAVLYSEDLDGDGFFDHPAQIYTYLEAIINARRGRRIDLTQDATVTIRGRRSFQSPPEQSITATLALTDRAPLALLFPPSADSPLALSGWANADDPIQNRYFLKTQELLLGEPWTFGEVGIFTISDNFSTLRFDGLQWHF